MAMNATYKRGEIRTIEYLAGGGIPTAGGRNADS
jgi:hypothetical protein